MFLFYIDESGTGLGDTRSPYFVLAALAVPIDKVQEMDARVGDLKRRLVNWAKPEDFEIKGRDLRRGEKFFKGQDWNTRAKAIEEIAQLIVDSPCRVFAVQVDKRDLPDYIGSDVDLYRLAFWRVLDEIEGELIHLSEIGMLMVDMRSDIHSSIQDRRLIDMYREWSLNRKQTLFAELPWFGFSAFYAGLQLADFVAYLIDSVTNEIVPQSKNAKLREAPMRRAFARFESKVRLVSIPYGKTKPRRS